MSNHKFLRAASAGALGLSLAACTTLHVTTDVNPAIPVASCHTYAFAHEYLANADQPAAYGNPLNGERLRLAVQNNLAARGIQLVDRASAQCVVGYALGTRQVFNDYYAGFGGWGGFGGGFGRRGGFGGGFYGGGFGGWDGPYVSDETRIAVDVFDAKSRTPIWHASVSQSVSDLTGPNAELKINLGAAAIFSKFPVLVAVPVTPHTT
jgi:hypothetical protein